MVPLEAVRASLLTIVTSESAGRERWYGGTGGTEGWRGDSSDGHFEGEELEDGRKSHECLKGGIHNN
jgi:hypothetical protein